MLNPPRETGWRGGGGGANAPPGANPERVGGGTRVGVSRSAVTIIEGGEMVAVRAGGEKDDVRGGGDAKR